MQTSNTYTCKIQHKITIISNTITYSNTIIRNTINTNHTNYKNTILSKTNYRKLQTIIELPSYKNNLYINNANHAHKIINKIVIPTNITTKHKMQHINNTTNQNTKFKIQRSYIQMQNYQ